MVQKHNSWEPEANVANAVEKLAEYWKWYAEKQSGVGETLGAFILK
jgi:dissimilatory sulfite reductase (desulfoviridin) alpha/beta subunit